MGNFASSSEWVHPSDNAQTTSRQTITPHTILPVVMPQAKPHETDIVRLLVTKAIVTCKQSIHHVLTTAIDTLTYSNALTSWEEEDRMDEVFGEFQIVYEDNYAPKNRVARTPAADTFQEAPWFQHNPCDVDAFKGLSTATWFACKDQKRDDDSRSATTDSTDWLSESDDTASENPASSTGSDLDDSDFGDEDDDVETKAARLLRMASTVADDMLLFVNDYLCACGKCPLYETIENDVARLVPWHGPEELVSITRILQAFSTYNETSAYDTEMIATADELLRLWCGDEDQAFSSFVVLHDEVPFLCGHAV